MATSIAIKDSTKPLILLFSVLSGYNFEISKNSKGDFVKVFYINSIVINVVNICFILLFLLCSYAFFRIAWYGISHDIIPANGSVTKISKGIELIFIAPMPLLISTAFHNYYKTLIIPIIRNGKRGSQINGSDVPDEKSKIGSLVDMGIIKYLFISICISTIFVFLLGKMINLSGEETKATDDITLHHYTGKANENFVNLVVETEEGKKIFKVCNSEFRELINSQKQTLKQNINQDLFVICLGFLLVILFIFYIRVISKNLNEDIDNAKKFSESKEMGPGDIDKALKDI